MPTRDLLQQRSDQYQSYVVRLLRTDDQHPWRIMVEVVSTRQQVQFKDVGALAEYFAAQMAASAPPPAAAPEVAD